MIHIQTNERKVSTDEMRDGDWAVADFGDQLVLARYQDSLVQGHFKPILLDRDLLEHLGFVPAPQQLEGTDTLVYELEQGRVSVTDDRKFVFEGGDKGKVSVDYLHLLQQIWRQTFDQELITDFLEQPHEITVN